MKINFDKFLGWSCIKIIYNIYNNILLYILYIIYSIKLCQSEKCFETLKLKPETRYSNISLQNTTSIPSPNNAEMKLGFSWLESLSFKE